MRHPVPEAIALNYSAYVADARLELRLIVYNPATPSDQRLIEFLIEARG